MPDEVVCQVYSGFVPHVWWPWNIDDLKKQFAADLQTTDLAVTTCSGLDTNLAAQWRLFYAAAIEWATSKTSWWGLGVQADQGQSYQCILYTWQTALAGASCKIVARNPNPLPSDAPAQAIKWVGVAVAAVAGAYVVGELVTVGMEAAKLLPARRKA